MTRKLEHPDNIVKPKPSGPNYLWMCDETEKDEEGCESSLLSFSGSATNQSLTFMPPPDEKGLQDKKKRKEKKEIATPWKSDVKEERDGQRKSLEEDDFWAASSQTLLGFFSAAWFTSVHPSPVPSPALYHPHPPLSPLSPALSSPPFQW